MFKFGWLIFTLFVVYSAVLIGIESVTSQDFVRNYVSDVEGPVPFFAVNTTLSVFLLWATALLFGICFACDRNDSSRTKACWFFLSQIMVFAWLGIDDRFKVHEYTSWRLGIADHYILLAVGFFEIGLMLTLGREIVFRKKPLLLLTGAALFFATTMFFDAIYPHDAFLRLSLEDVAKTWSGLFFCLFAWHLAMERIGHFKAPEQTKMTGVI